MTSEEIQKEISELKMRVEQLEKSSQLIFPLDIVSEELIRNTIVQREDTSIKTETLNVAATSTPFSNNYTVVKKFSGGLRIKWKDKEYIIGYWNVT